MENIWQQLQQITANPLWALGSVVLALVLAIVLYQRGQRNRKPTFFIKSFNLVSDFSSKVAKLQMTYDTQPIESLTISKIAFWNDGAQTIDSRDIPEADPIRIVAKEVCSILDVSVIYRKNEANMFQVIPNDDVKSIKISFDYLDRNEGGVIQLIHTGKSSSDIEILGTVKGVGKPRPRYARSRVFDIIDKLFPTPKPIKVPPLWARRFVGISFIVVAIIIIYMAFVQNGPFMWISTLVVVCMYIYMGYTFLRRRIPRGFEIVEAEI